jgi:transcriptional regulator with XRE-family HTH domain
MESFPQLLARYIRASGIKQKHLAMVAGISVNYLQRIISGDRRPSEQVVQRLVEALSLNSEQAGVLLAAAGYPPHPEGASPGASALSSPAPSLPDAELTRLMQTTQEWYRLAREVGPAHEIALLDEMRTFLSYLRYKYVFCGSADLLHLQGISLLTRTEVTASPLPLDVLAQIVEQWHTSDPTTPESGHESEKLMAQGEELLLTLDQLAGTVLSGIGQAHPSQLHSR